MTKAFDPRLTQIEDFTPHAYDDLMRAGTFPPESSSEDSYQACVDYFHHKMEGVAVERITYDVDGVAVTGLMAMPKTLNPKGHPILIYNRGGNAEFGKLTVAQVVNRLGPLAKAGYLVLASNYRGADGGEGQDEYGGRDVQDVLELLDIARNHPSWDGKNAYMLGASRGGMMTCMALREGAKVNAAAVIAGPTDLVNTLEERPAMENVYRARIPDYENTKQEALTARSPLCWPEDIHAPLLMLHGGDDARVDVSHASNMDAALQKLGKPSKIIIYPDDNHFLSKHGVEALEEVKDWFTQHKNRERSADVSASRGR